MISFFKNYEVKKKNLLEFLTPTSKGTRWYESPPDGFFNSRVVGRFLLQFHQVAEQVQNYKLEKKLKFLDVGSGNGLLPELISKSFSCLKSVGMDPFEDGEHITSHAKNSRKKLLDNCLKYIKNKKSIKFEDYENLLKYEGYASKPNKVYFSKQKKDWEFQKKFIEQLKKNQKYNFIFAKCIDHVHNWRFLIKEISIRSEKNAVLMIKHNSFFSFNGAHRYASTFIPWGHVLLRENEYISYVKKFHKSREKQMINFYYNNLSYPRTTIDDLKLILKENNWKIEKIEFGINKNIKKMLKNIGGAKNLLKKANRNFKHLSLAELMSSRIILIAKKIS